MPARDLLKIISPAHPDIKPIFQEIRKKYNLPEIDSEMDDFNEIFYADNQPNWDNVREDIERLVYAIPDLIPEHTKKLYDELSTMDKDSPEFLRMKMEGKKERDILDVYIQRNPSQFPKDKSSKEYAQAVRKLRERITVR